MNPVVAFKESLYSIGNFIYETPVSIVLCTVTGIALIILFPPLAPPLLGFSAAAITARILSKVVIYAADPVALAKTNEQLDLFHSRCGRIHYIILIPASATAFFASPLAGGLIAAGVGLYEGFMSEVFIAQSKQEMRKQRVVPPVAREQLAAI